MGHGRPRKISERVMRGLARGGIHHEGAKITKFRRWFGVRKTARDSKDVFGKSDHYWQRRGKVSRKGAKSAKWRA